MITGVLQKTCNSPQFQLELTQLPQNKLSKLIK